MPVVHRSAFAACLGLVLACPVQADTLQPFIGSWGGSGRVVVDDGKSEQIKCNGYYRQTDGQNGLGVAIRCASPSYSIQLRSALTANGTQLSGTWEERTFNVHGNLSGRIEAGRMVLNVDGGGMKATMSISVTGGSQSVLLTTQGSGLKEVRMSLARAVRFGSGGHGFER